MIKGACIKYVGEGGGEEFYKFFKKKKKNCCPGDHRPKFFMAQYFFRKYFMASSINFSFLFKAYLQQYFREVLTIIFKFQITKEVDINNTIQKNIFKKFSKKSLIIFTISKFVYNSKIKIISEKSIISSSTINHLN